MFITRKRFEEAIERAKRETEERMWREQRMDRMENCLHERMDKMNERLFRLEAAMAEKQPIGFKKPDGCEEKVPVPPANF